MALFRRRRKLPDSDRPALERDERVVAWAASPRHSPDADYKGRISSPADFATPIQKVTAEVRREIAERLPALQKSTTLRAFWRWLTARG